MAVDLPPQLPRWEIGAGVGGLSMPEYRGSDERRQYLLPVPAFAYRLDWLHADRSGVRARLLDTPRFELNVSLGATPPVRSNSSQARSGMPDVRPMIEVGPALDVHLWRSAAHGLVLDLRLPLRESITVGTHPQAMGATFAPRLNLDLLDVRLPGMAANPWQVGLSGGPVYAGRRLDSYLYSVAPADARPDRPAYCAPGGYAGAQLFATISRREQSRWMGAFLRLDSVRGAVFEASPLVRRRDGVSVGFAVTWTIRRSRDTVASDDDGFEP